MTKWLSLLVVLTLLLPSDVPPQCDTPSFARVNPGLCFDTPFPDLSGVGGGGGSGGGGILGTIGRVLGSLTGGLL